MHAFELVEKLLEDLDYHAQWESEEVEIRTKQGWVDLRERLEEIRDETEKEGPL